MPPSKTEEKVTHRPVPPLAQSGAGVTLPCGCRLEIHNHHGVMVTYCPRHTTFIFSPRHNGTDVFYFVTEDERP